MPQLRIQVEEWQQAVLSAMARARGLGVEAVAQGLLLERLSDGIRRVCEDLVTDAAQAAESVPDTIEHRLRQVFDF